MDDKTAAIPSLKDFKDKQKNSGKKGDKSKAKNNRRKPLSQDTMRLDKVKSDASSKQRSARNDKGRNSAPKKNNTRSSSAPSSYARERMSGKSSDKSRSSDYDSSRRVDRSAQTQRRSEAASNTKKPTRTKEQRISSYYGDVPSKKPANSKNAENNGVNNSPRTQGSAPRNSSQSRQKPKPEKTPKRKPQSRRPVEKKEKKPLTERDKKIRRIKLYILLGFLFCLVLSVLSLTVFFKAKTIEVNGLERYAKKDVVTACGITEDDNIFTANKKRAEERIEKLYPYVEDANVRAVFPTKISIDLKMAKPACKINAIGGVYIVSNKGKVLEVTDNADDVDVPAIEGIQIKGRAEGEFVDYGSDVLTRALEEMFAAFSKFESTKINEINIITKGDISKGDGFEIRYVYDNRIVVYMGIPEEVEYKIQVADKIIAKLHENEGTAVTGELDVSTCFDDNSRAYFNPYSILDPDTAAPVTQTESEEPTEPAEY